MYATTPIRRQSDTQRIRTQRTDVLPRQRQETSADQTGYTHRDQRTHNGVSPSFNYGEAEVSQRLFQPTEVISYDPDFFAADDQLSIGSYTADSYYMTGSTDAMRQPTYREQNHAPKSVSPQRTTRTQTQRRNTVKRVVTQYEQED